tara:strand:- start:688 stop:1680 length:993 start_codon:yes stop_codon:yes gene_type:complete
MNHVKKITIYALFMGVILVLSPHAAAETCRSCNGLKDGGVGQFFFELAIPEGQTYSPGKLNVFEKKGELCCLKGTAMTFPSSAAVYLNKREQVLFVEGIDGRRKNGFTRGLLRYDLTSAAMSPTATHMLGSKQCKKGRLIAFVQGEKIVERKGAPSASARFKQYTLRVLNLDLPIESQQSVVASGKHLKKAARLLSFGFSEDCKTLTYPGKKRGKSLTFTVPHELAAQEKTPEAEEIKVAISGKIVSCPEVKQGETPTFPVPLAFTVEDVVPAGDIGTAGLKTLSYRVGKKAFEKFNMVYLSVDTPVQVVLEGTNQLPLKDFTVVSVEHR